ARFPYIFVDEFQDTNPVQTQVVNWLAESGSIVGVIGDPEQSIYGFQGAQRKDFVDFSLPNLMNYKISDNRRSTTQIVSFLNHVRADKLVQKPLRETEGVLLRDVPGEPVCAIVGETVKAVEHALSCVSDGSELHVLARNNDEVARLRTQTEGPSNDTWESFAESDSKRARFFEHLVTGVETARLGNFTVGLKELLRVMRMRNGTVRKPLKCPDAVSVLQCRGIVLSLLESLITRYQELATLSLMSVYELVSSTLGSSFPGLSLSGVRPGKFKEFAEATNYSDLAVAIRLADETRTVRTMHNAKGAEFANVLVSLGDVKENRLGHILNDDDCDEDEHRVTYVAISRAQIRLFLSVPSLTDDEERQLRKLGLGVEYVS
ncbi:MAG: ATP-dependent helicase, partial [Planctomycetes bacterium]|nr:ATP-dependent helicase [Planctomycetota bacterium]